jgi:DNA-binding NarL/FixJ family response regulator
MSERIRVLIAEDHALVREGTRHMLEQHDDLEVVAEVGNGERAVSAASRLAPDVALLDIKMPELNGVEATKRIRAESPSTAVLILSAYDDDDYVTGLIAAGAAGYLLKTVRSDELVDAVRRVHHGETVLHPEVARKVAQLWRREVSPANHESPLTDKEEHVLRLVCRGLHNKEIAQELSVSVRTVEGHMSGIFARLNVHSRTEAALLAMSRGWFNGDDV